MDPAILCCLNSESEPKARAAAAFRLQGVKSGGSSFLGHRLRRTYGQARLKGISDESFLMVPFLGLI